MTYKEKFEEVYGVELKIEPSSISVNCSINNKHLYKDCPVCYFDCGTDCLEYEYCIDCWNSECTFEPNNKKLDESYFM